MTSAKVTISEQDRSSIIPAVDGSYAGIVIVSEKGPVNTPILISDETKLIDTFGKPNPKLGTSIYSAIVYLKQGNKLWVVRSAHEDAAYAAALVRSKVTQYSTDPGASLSDDSLIVLPLKDGLTQAQLDAYQFPTYSTNKLYEDSTASVVEAVSQSNKVRVSDLTPFKVDQELAITTKTIEELNDQDDDVGENEPTHRITNIVTEKLNIDNVIVKTAVTVTAGTEIKKKVVDGDPIAYDNHPVVLKDVKNSTNILVSSSDYIAKGDTLVIGDVEVEFSQKTSYQDEAKYIELDATVDVTDLSSKIAIVTQSEFEDRDAFLVYASSPSVDGKNITIGTAPSTNYDSAFIILVYYKGVLVEQWEVTRDHQLDGFQKQMFMEEKINGKSAYIMVKNNPADVDENGEMTLPLFTDYSLWQQLPEDQFVESGATLEETLLAGHIEVKMTNVAKMNMGTRIKFVTGNGTVSKEYKVVTVNSASKSVIVDRKIEEAKIDPEWTNGSGTKTPTAVLYFDATLNDSAQGIKNGIKYYSIKRIDKVYYNYPLNYAFTISGVIGTLLSAGANMLLGGSLGSTVTTGDMVTSVKKLKNKEATPVTLLMDGGTTVPAYAQAIQEVCESQGLTHGYLSSQLSDEESVNYLNAIVAYKDSLQLGTSSKVSFFAGWIKFFDEYNQLYVWISPESFAAASQSFTTREFQMFYPAAGWNRSAMTGALDVRVQFDETDRDYLVDNRINPIRSKKGTGLAIWGNETMLTKPSPLQLRSVAMLLIKIKTGLEASLEYKTFDLNNERTWDLVEGSIDGFMRDEIKAKDGVYNYRVAVKDVITDSDIDNRKMPVFIGIQPTMDIQEIPVTLAIFNSSVDISVSL